MCDLVGWTKKEYTVFRGHIKIVELLAVYEAGDYRALVSSIVLRTRMVRSGEMLKCALTKQMRMFSRLEPSSISLNNVGL